MMRQRIGSFLAAAVLMAAGLSFGDMNGIGVVKYSKGNVRVTVDGVEKELQGSDLLSNGEKFASGQDGKAVLRMLPDQAFVEIRPKTVFTLKRVKVKDKRLRRVKMDAGEVVFGLKKKSEPMQCETTHTQATASTGKFACKSDESGTAMILVQDGEVTVYNRPKDLTAVVRSGQKAVSDLNGIKVSDATDSELEQVGFRQNTLEVDFVNPETEEFTTLEVEYETNF
jgi:hypothetical protein